MTLEFGKEKTAIIKGLAIIFMIILHCSIPGNWDISFMEFDSENWVRFMGVFKLCVGIFTFMVGYGYAFSKNKDLKYGLIHIRKLLIPFWIILIIFTLPVCYSQIGGGNILFLNMIGINSRLNWFSWFVAFYIFAMIVMPFVGRLIDQKPLFYSLVCIGAFFTGEVALYEFYPNYTENDWTQRLFDCLLQTPCMILGYLFAKQHWFTMIHIPQSKYMSLLAFFLIVGILIARSLKSAFWGFNLDFFYAPLFIFSVLIMTNQLSNRIVSKVLTILGNTSVYMWFFHALFFTKVTRELYQPFVAVSDSFWIVTSWTILLTFVCSWCILFVVNKIEKKLK